MLQLISKWLQKASRYSGSKFHSGIFFSMFQFIPPYDRGHKLIFPNEPISLFYPAPLLVFSGSSRGGPQHPTAASSSAVVMDDTNYCNMGWGEMQSQPWKFSFSLFFHLTLLAERWRPLHYRRVVLSESIRKFESESIRCAGDHGKELLLRVKAGLSIAGLSYPAHYCTSQLCSLGSQGTLDFFSQFAFLPQVERQSSSATG